MANAGKREYVPFSSAEDCKTKLGKYFGTYLQSSGEIADVESLADFLHVTREELIALKSDKLYGRNVSLAFNRIAKIKKQLAFCGKLNATVLSFDLRNNHGYADKAEKEDGDTSPVIFRGKVEKWAK